MTKKPKLQKPVIGWAIVSDTRDVVFLWIGTKPRDRLLRGEQWVRVRIVPVDGPKSSFDNRVDKLTDAQRTDIASLERELKRAKTHKNKRETVDTIAEILYPERLGNLIVLEPVTAKEKALAAIADAEAKLETNNG